MSELMQGPANKWEPSPEDKETIARSLESDSELARAYGEAYTSRCYVREFYGLTAVGDLDDLVEWEFRTGQEINIGELSMEDCIFLGAFPGVGPTRAAAIRHGVGQVQDERRQLGRVQLDT